LCARTRTPLRTHRPKELSKNLGLEIPPARADPVGSLEVGEHEDVEQFGAGSGTEGVQALTEPALELLKVHRSDASTRRLRTGVQFTVRTDAFEGVAIQPIHMSMFRVP